uniref:Uncharacterized protein n=1 Tax=Acidobacterium capsulatum TaxID=33075 RepID=A0A7V4XRQ1_9BACT
MPANQSLSRPLPSAIVRLACVLTAAGCLLVTGCKVDVHKSTNGDNKDVKIQTPFGGMNVQSNQTTATSLGLPTYPGAQMVTDDGDNKSANVEMGFGPFHLVVKVVHYQTSNPRKDVVEFYRKALSQFGTVIACNNDTPVGTPTRTNEGLTCDESHGHTHVDLHDSDNGYNLRAGSPHHQWIVGFKDNGPGTRFSLVELELPVNDNQSSSKAD